MKNILNKEEMLFIKNLSNEMNTQDNRCTAKPYTYRVQQSEKVISLDRDKYENLGILIDNDEPFDNIEDCVEYVNDRIYEDFIYEEDVHSDNYVNIKTKSDLEHYLDKYSIKYEYYSWKYIDSFNNSHQGGSNCFLTEKACEEFIESNSHNLCNPRSYIVHEFRNPEMRKLIDIIHKLAEQIKE